MHLLDSRFLVVILFLGTNEFILFSEWPTLCLSGALSPSKLKCNEMALEETRFWKSINHAFLSKYTLQGVGPGWQSFFKISHLGFLQKNYEGLNDCCFGILFVSVSPKVRLEFALHPFLWFGMVWFISYGWFLSQVFGCLLFGFRSYGFEA